MAKERIYPFAVASVRSRENKIGKVVVVDEEITEVE